MDRRSHAFVSLHSAKLNHTVAVWYNLANFTVTIGALQHGRCHSHKMAGDVSKPRFVLTDDEILKLIYDADASNTKIQIKYAVKRLEEFARHAGTSFNCFCIFYARLKGRLRGRPTKKSIMDKDLFRCCIKQIMNVSHSCNGKNNFIWWQMEGSIPYATSWNVSYHRTQTFIIFILYHWPV